jgi:hypothetical protein
VFNLSSQTTFSKVEIINALGQVVSMKSSDGMQNVTFDLSDQKSGIYLARIFNDNAQFTQRIVIK